MKVLFVVIGLAMIPVLSQAQEMNCQIDLRHVGPSSSPVSFPMSGTGRGGETLTVNSRYFEKDGRPWFPLMGEMHYNRVRREDWELEILKMKEAGLSIVATYIFWNEHERTPGVWDWTGNRDLRHFIELCGKHGMYVWLRCGPWSHGEQLNGGFPDWIEAMKGRRTNDPAYLEKARVLFEQIGGQTSGLFFSQGGPVIGAQLENEYASGQPGHISILKRMALEAGIDPVFWSVTANTVFDDSKMEVIPLQGSYPYRGWEPEGGKATADFLYGDDQWIMTDALGKVFYDVDKYPKGLCEQGCGSQMTYPNRFVVEPYVVEAHLQNQVGRGMNMVGYYMFRGGTQTPGLKEPGLPESYDFQAPIGEYGYIRPSYNYLKTLHYFLNDFGSDLVQMQVVRPAAPVRDPLDTQDLRYIVREKDNSGYLFLCNAQVRVHMPDKRVRFSLLLPDETIVLPPLLLKGQTSPILPFNLRLDGVTLKYVTAQVLARSDGEGSQTVFFQRLPGVDPQVAVADSVIRVGGRRVITLKGSRGKKLVLVFLSREEALEAWKVDETLAIAGGDLIRREDSIELRQWGDPAFALSVYSPDAMKFVRTSHVLPARKTGVVVRRGVDSNDVIVELPRGLPSGVSDVMLRVRYDGSVCRAMMGDSVVADDLNNGEAWLLGLHKFLGKGSFRLKVFSVGGQRQGRIKDIKIIPQYHYSFARRSPAIAASDYGVKPNSGENASPALRKAIEACRKNGASILELPGGRMDLWPEGAEKKELYISNATEDDTLSKVKSIAMLLEGFKGLTIRGNKTLLVLHGKMVSFALLHCSDISIRGIRVDYERPTMSEMTIGSVSPRAVEVKIHPDSKYRIDDTGRIHLYGEGWETRNFHTMVFDPAKETMRYGSFGPFLHSKAVSLGRWRVRFEGDFSRANFHSGEVLTIRDPYRDNVGALIEGSRNITLDDVDMYYMHGLGIVSQFSENIALLNVRVAPRRGSGRVVSSFADCFHFSGCRGTILLDSCLASGAHDDPVNVHGTHLKITSILADGMVRVRFMHPQTWGFQAFYPHDSIAYVDPNTLLPVGYGVVNNVRMISRREMELQLDGPIPEGVKVGVCLENITWTPSLVIRNCRFERTGTRGVLVTTCRKVLIEHNTFYRTGMHAILIADDATGWYESGPVRDVTIRHNKFIECGYNSAPDNYIISIDPDIRETRPGGFVHSNIRIEDNYFKVYDGLLLTARSVDGLRFVRNVVEHSDLMKGDRTRPPFRIVGCRGVVVDGM